MGKRQGKRNGNVVKEVYLIIERIRSGHSNPCNRSTDNSGNAAGTFVEITVPFSLSEKAKKNLYDTSHYN